MVKLTKKKIEKTKNVCLLHLFGLVAAAKEENIRFHVRGMNYK